MEQPPSFIFRSCLVALYPNYASYFMDENCLLELVGKFSIVIPEIGMTHSGADHSVFCRHSI